MQDNSGPSWWGSEDTEFILVEWHVLSLILILLVVFVVLSLLLAAWTLFFQGYIYSEPVSAIYWRAPAASAALTLFLGIWVAFDYNSIHDRNEEGRYQPLHNFSYSEIETYEYLWIYRDDRKEQFTRQGNQYVSRSGRRLPERPLQIIASHKAEGDEHVFKPRLDDKGRFQPENGQVRYYEEGNNKRYMEERSIGQVSTSRFSWLLMALVLNFGFLLVWFLSLWLLLQFQWPHALGLAFVAWLISLFILPMILTQAEKVRKERLPPKTTARCLPQMWSGWLEARVRQRQDRGDDHHQSLLLMENVMHDKRRHVGHAKFGRLKRQVAQRVAELRVEVETSIHLLHGRENLGIESPFLRPGNKFLQLILDKFRVSHPIGNWVV